MLLDHDPGTGVLRVDQDGFDALTSACRDPEQAPPEAVTVMTALTGQPLDRALTLAAGGIGEDPVLTLSLTVAGPRTRLVHRVWLGPSGCAMLLGVHADVFQLVPHDPAFLPAALARLARLKPRRTTAADVSSANDVTEDTSDAVFTQDEERRTAALAALGADYAWRLEFNPMDSGDDSDAPPDRVMTVLHGPTGVRCHLSGTPAFVPTTNTELFRLLSALAPTRTLPATV